MFRLVQKLADDGIDVAVTCRVLSVSRSGYYEWRERPLSARDLADAHLANTVVDVHKMSRGSYGAPRMHAEMRLELGIRVGRKRIARLLRLTGRAGIGDNTHRRRRKKPAPAPHEDLVQRRFVADEPNRLWCTDSTEHPTGGGTVYLACVEDVFSRQIVGWSIANHMRSELVVDALQMATWRRRPTPGTVVHSDRGSQGGSNWSSQHLDLGGVDGQASVGSVGDALDNALAESEIGLFKTELIRRQGPWKGLDDVELGTLEWVDWHNHRRLHSACYDLPPVEYEQIYYGRHPAQHGAGVSTI